MEIIMCILTGIVGGAFGGVIANIMMGNGPELAAAFLPRFKEKPERKAEPELSKSPVYRIYEE